MKQKLKNAFGGDKLILIGATVVVFAMFTLLNRNFLSWTNFVNILGQGIRPAPQTVDKINSTVFLYKENRISISNIK